MNTTRFFSSLRLAFRGLDLDQLGRLTGVLAICTFLLAATSAFAAPAGDVDVSLRSFRVVAANGKTTLQPTEEARPNDVIEYQVSYRNTGKVAARQVAATLPVPPGAMAYLAGSAAPQRVEVSLDGKSFAPAPLTREVLRDGRKQIEQVPVSEYRFLRWNLGDIPAGQALTVSARMRVLSGIDAK